MKDELIVVAGGGGFIGGHLVADLRRRGYWRIRSVDVKPLEEWYQVEDECDNVVADLKELEACRSACEGATTVYNLAADMGGMGFIENNKALCMLSVLINTHLLMAAREADVERFFYACSACVYNADKQRSRGRCPAQGGRRLSRDARRRLRLGKTLLRAHVPPLSRGFRPAARGSPGSTTSTVRTAPGTAAARRRRRRFAAR